MSRIKTVSSGETQPPETTPVAPLKKAAVTWPEELFDDVEQSFIGTETNVVGIQARDGS